MSGWGNSVPMPAPAALGETTTRGLLDIKLSRSTLVALQLFADTVQVPLGAASTIDQWADIHWGSGGANFNAQVDFGYGTNVLLVAEHVQVNANYTVSAGALQDCQVSAALAPAGGKSVSSRPIRTIQASATADNGTTVLIPPFARTVTIGGRRVGFLPPPSIRARFQSFAPGVTALAVYETPPDTPTEYLIPSLARQLIVTPIGFDCLILCQFGLDL